MSWDWMVVVRLLACLMAVSGLVWGLLKGTSFLGGPQETEVKSWESLNQGSLLLLLVLCFVGVYFTIPMGKTVETAAMASVILFLIGAFICGVSWICLSLSFPKDETPWQKARDWSSYWRVSFGQVRFYNQLSDDPHGLQLITDWLGLAHYYSGMVTRHDEIPLGSRPTKRYKLGFLASPEALLKTYLDEVKEIRACAKTVLGPLARAQSGKRQADAAIRELGRNGVSVHLLEW
jgi:hypothetical protein